MLLKWKGNKNGKEGFGRSWASHVFIMVFGGALGMVFYFLNLSENVIIWYHLSSLCGRWKHRHHEWNALSMEATKDTKSKRCGGLVRIYICSEHVQAIWISQSIVACYPIYFSRKYWLITITSAQWMEEVPINSQRVWPIVVSPHVGIQRWHTQNDWLPKMQQLDVESKLKIRWNLLSPNRIFCWTPAQRLEPPECQKIPSVSCRRFWKEALLSPFPRGTSFLECPSVKFWQSLSPKSSFQINHDTINPKPKSWLRIVGTVRSLETIFFSGAVWRDEGYSRKT